MEAGFNCCQAILSTYGSELGLDESLAKRIASGFGGGMARMGETCGPVTGAFMVIGLNLNVAKNVEQKRERVCKIRVHGAFFGPQLSTP